MSIVSDLSSTLPDVALFLSGSADPALAYKLFILASISAIPWLIVAAGLVWRLGPGPIACGLALYELHLWSDSFTFGYAVMGMVGYLVSVPFGLLTVAAVTAYLDRGGFGRWLAAASACAAAFLVHLTGAMLVAPAAGLAYAVAAARSRRPGRPLPASRHLGFWAIAPVVLAANAFWWVPGLRLASTKGGSDFAFSHSAESVWWRVGDIFWDDAPAQAMILSLGLVGLAVRARRDPVGTAGLAGLMAAGFGWGYLAGAFPALDSLQPGRHTYAFYTAGAVAAGIALTEALARLRSDRRPRRLDLWMMVVLAAIGVRVFGKQTVYMHRLRMSPEPNMSSRPTPRLLWLVARLREHTRPGERLLFEETGIAVPGLGDPFYSRHCSPVLPHLVGVEVIGGPYLHATVTTNFTQFGEDKLFGDPDWDRDRFVRYARLYRPAAIACWSPHARAFCEANPDLIRVVADDKTLMIGRVLGFEGGTIRGRAEVTAGPNRIQVEGAVAGDDGLVVLRYHAVPHLRSEPPVEWQPVYLEEDPVPFIAFRPNGGTVVFSMKPAPWSK
jgi:hypothetical protein